MINRKLTMASILALCLAASACGKADDRAASTSSAKATTNSSSNQASATQVTDVAKEAKTAMIKTDIKYRAVTATLRGSDEKIQIMVPEDIDVPSGRLIEYYQTADGDYYYKSVIPN